MPFAQAPDGIRLYYETLGSGEPLLLVAGRHNDHFLWNYVREDFSAHYQVIVYDQRGTGQSDKPEHPPYSTRMFAQDAVAILDHLGVSRAHAYGASMGGLVCQWIALDHADRLGALVLGCTTPGRSHRIERPPEVAALINQKDPNPLKTLALLYSPWWLVLHLDYLRQWGESTTPVPPYVEAMHTQASESHDTWDALPGIHASTLVIHGTKDKVSPVQNAHLLAERIPDAELYLVKGGRHIFFVEYRKESSRVVNDFLSRHPLA
jgi:pimeloyl-ACP methyl ester carboxylesterase